ncbi:class I adenylate-forming enzyme family protein [Streptomonospora salina]|uniref:Acyl-coenzyme A synthetase/AMP-(Fatty) acid ligase n=1 Tax=Streptomonospora salina TaxID=104205 RepID=A0A841EHA2_9ACTN|nr:AMP-binding protein [Streptomonospora salina]MBB5999760.1 acyl-coenzyme A synthetase/AMP-(fatty) acid ligase [Streptomonospora salina]
MKRLDVATLFDTLADRHSPTTAYFSRPLDIDPGAAAALGVADLAGLVEDASGWLAAAGAGPGDRVAIVKDNHWDIVLLAMAAVRIGAVPAPLAAHLAPATLGTLLARLQPGLAVLDGAAAERFAAVGIEPTARRVLLLDGPPEVLPGAVPLSDVRGRRAPAPRRRRDDEPLLVVHTSGTTGTPKLVVHSGATIVRRLIGFEARRWPVLSSRPDDTVAAATSFVHGRAFAWTASVFWLRPHAVGLIADHDPDRAGPFLREHPPTTLEALPATYVRWQHLARGEGGTDVFGRVRLYISTFDAVHPPAVRTFLAASGHRRPVWLQGWGQSETGPLTFRLLTRASVAEAGGRSPTTRDLGRPVPGRTRLSVVDPATLRPVPRGRPGLILARTPALGLGYVGEPERWAAKAPGRWWNTEDIGMKTRTGSVRVLDREIDSVPGMSCVEVEDVVDDRIPGVLECVVLRPAEGPPLPVVVTESGRLDLETWRRATADLPTMTDPLVMAWDDLPRTGTGKVRRPELRARLLGTPRCVPHPRTAGPEAAEL